MSTILDRSNLPIALGARVGVIFEVIRLGDPGEQSNLTLRVEEPCPGSNFRPEISLNGSCHCVVLGDGVPQGKTGEGKNPQISQKPAEEDEREGLEGLGGLVCGVCGVTVPEGVDPCPNCGTPVQPVRQAQGEPEKPDGGGTAERDPDPVPGDLKPSFGEDPETHSAGSGQADTQPAA